MQYKQYNTYYKILGAMYLDTYFYTPSPDVGEGWDRGEDAGAGVFTASAPPPQPSPVAGGGREEFLSRYIDVHCVGPTLVHSPLGVGTQHAASLQRPYGSWRCMYETDI